VVEGVCYTVVARLGYLGDGNIMYRSSLRRIVASAELFSHPWAMERRERWPSPYPGRLLNVPRRLTGPSSHMVKAIRAIGR
jgi:hypothetical protein